ncbi:MAG: hypothetical protein GY720_18980 [bacterium]|nr:hypothetical protein [bacterium]
MEDLVVAQLGSAIELAGEPHHIEPGLMQLEPGRIVGLVGHPGYGLTRVGLSMLAAKAGKSPVAYLDVRGWLCPVAAWESGVDPEQLVVVRCADPVRWGRALTALLEGVGWIYAEVPRGVKEAQLRRLAGLVRTRRAALVLRPVQGDLPSGVAYLRLEAGGVNWEGTEAGHGKLASRYISFAASGKATRGMTRQIELEDNGTDALHLVPGLAVAPSGRTAG